MESVEPGRLVAGRYGLGAVRWELRGFGAGWLIRERASAGRRGGATRVIERETGLVMRFPSGIPPTVIMEEYAEVREGGHPQDG